MNTRTLGNEGLMVSELGWGCMGMSASYRVGDEGESIATIHLAVDEKVGKPWNAYSTCTRTAARSPALSEIAYRSRAS